MIKARIRFVTASCIVSVLCTVYILSQYVHASRREILRLLGWWPVGLPELYRPVLLTCLLFTGPLFERGIVEGGWREWVTLGPLVSTLGDWIGWRNYIAVRLLLPSLHTRSSISYSTNHQNEIPLSLYSPQD